MKKIFLLGVVLASTITLMAQPPKGNADKGDIYGEKFEYTKTIDVTTLPQNLTAEKPIKGAFIAQVVEVCPNKGCWLKLKIDDNTTAMVKMKDYGFFVPTAAKGKTVVLNAEASIKELSVAELKHFAEDAKKSKEEIEAITKPEKQINLLASGIIVVN
ncbi:MAG: DUF4920 domain-containing protein [Chitinophagales bacterium]|nr:DUF4920 domain-containing protein [Chitinophagales bacterium]